MHHLTKHNIWFIMIWFNLDWLGLVRIWHSSAQPFIICPVFLLQHIFFIRRSHPPRWPPWRCNIPNLDQSEAELGWQHRQKPKQKDRNTEILTLWRPRPARQRPWKSGLELVTSSKYYIHYQTEFVHPMKSLMGLTQLKSSFSLLCCYNIFLFI